MKMSQHRVELCYQWIQNVVVENIETGILDIPPPLLSRSFQELAHGLVDFHDAMRISSVPFPFPYAQTCDILLIAHALMTPFVIAPWISRPWWAFVLSFIQVFVLDCLNRTAKELQNPFGTDPNDIDAATIQKETNARLLHLLRPGARQTPKLSSTAIQRQSQESSRRMSFRKSLTGVLGEELHVVHSESSEDVEPSAKDRSKKSSDLIQPNEFSSWTRGAAASFAARAGRRSEGSREAALQTRMRNSMVMQRLSACCSPRQHSSVVAPMRDGLERISRCERSGNDCAEDLPVWSDAIVPTTLPAPLPTMSDGMDLQSVSSQPELS